VWLHGCQHATAGNTPGFAGPLIILPARRLLGWEMYGNWVAAGTFLQGILYWRYVTLRSARQLYDQMHAKERHEAGSLEWKDI
jgi:hypothetical protein